MRDGRTRVCAMRARVPAWALALACAALAPAAAPAAAASHARLAWEGSADLEGFHTTDLFPAGGVHEGADGLALDLRGAVQVRTPLVRVKPWARVVAERYQEWPDRDLERWSGGVDVRRGPHRLRLFGEATNDELYFPSSAGGAWLDRRVGGAELRLGLGPGWLGQVTYERERDAFRAPYDLRDASRWTVRYELTREFGPERSVSLTYLYRRHDSVTDLYTYDHNALRAGAGWAVRAWSARLEGEGAVRNYRTAHEYDPNFARQDRRWRVNGSIGRTVLPHVQARVFGEYRRNRSTRWSKNYDVRVAGLALEVSR